MITIGIDPGLKGAVGVLNDGQLIDVFDLPVMVRGKTKTKINAAGLTSMLRKHVTTTTVAMVEQVWAMPQQGASSGCSLGHSVGVCEGVCFALGVRTHLITPQKWKKYYGLSSDKELARARAIEYWPSAELHLKRHADRAEALLMARYMFEINRPVQQEAC